MENTVVMLGTDSIMEHPSNPRKDLGDLTELSESIRKNGIFQNLIVVPASEGGKYVVIMGHRRLAAAKLAGLTEVPCVVTEMTEEEQVENMLLENMQRENLTSYEEAHGFAQLSLDFGKSVDEIAEATGFSKTKVRQRIRMTEIKDDVLKKGCDCGATISDFIELEKVKDIELRNKVAESLGTNNFRSELQRAIDAEKNKENRERLIAELSAIAEPTEKTLYGEGYECKHFYISSANKVELPEGADPAEKMLYYADDWSVILFYKKAKEENPAQKAFDEHREWRNQATEKEEDVVARIKALRRDFVKNFGNVNGKQKELISGLARLTCGDLKPVNTYYGGNGSTEKLAELLGIGLVETKQGYGTCKTVDPDAYAKLLEDKPLYTMFVSAFVESENCINDTLRTNYSPEGVVHPILYLNDTELKKHKGIYEVLESLGYVMSDEEIEFVNGTFAERIFADEPERVSKANEKAVEKAA